MTFEDWIIEIKSHHLAIEYLRRVQSILDGSSEVSNRRKLRSQSLIFRVVVLI
jgi:hypothetical protein